jgi:DNA-nicking Smr family endonuclease
MDFGDILAAWDGQTAKAQGAQKNRSGEKTGKSPEKIDPLTAWLRIHGVEDKDAEAAVEMEPGERRRRLLRKKPDAVLDLHGLTRDEAWITLDGFFRESRRQGFEKLLLVHGKGNHSQGEAILKQTCREFIERCPFAGEQGRSDAADGGSGATWVLIKPENPGA